MPDICPKRLMEDKPDFYDLSFANGDFTKLFGTGKEGMPQKEQFDCVATCYFIDTATNVLDYMECIQHVLKPGGLWVNLGPL